LCIGRHFVSFRHSGGGGSSERHADGRRRNEAMNVPIVTFDVLSKHQTHYLHYQPS
jgi:hypothetical protein